MGRKAYLTDEQRRENILIAKRNYNKKRTKESRRKDYIRQRNHNPNFKNVTKRCREKAKIKFQKDLEILAGRPKPLNCEVCGNEGKICYDHCHKTEKFRGWICDPCNIALGKVKDNPETLRKLANYLEKV